MNFNLPVTDKKVAVLHSGGLDSSTAFKALGLTDSIEYEDK